MTKPIRIRLISEYLVVSVNLGQLRRDSFMRSYWGPEWLSFLRYWTALKPKHKKLLIVSWEDTTAGQSSKGMFFQKMLSEAGSLGWMVARCEFPETPMELVDISLCQDIFNAAKPYV